MKQQIYKNRKSFLQTAIALLIVPGASGAVFAQDKYPKPDFTAMEEYYEIVD